ncbi:unnamed protein product [Prorocentrum cordatum]|uniref:Uncharacterized protein n=1 Tax=Prorocentrum cordatum TaxID=2364126 RepID=A0ABN9XBL3_9DINO|nr:unnamed protein product [Polarella glacialis]
MGDDGPAGAPPAVGQHVNLAGTGQRWTGQKFGAIVVDVRGSDGTVKVRYTDGGFKRFGLEEFRALASVPEPKSSLDNWQVGQHVHIAGTGQWWAGSGFGAKIVDVRKSDATVKVRYTDGGFKRFKVEEFAALVSEQQAAPAMWEEWHSASQEGEVSELRRLHDGVMLATRTKGDLEYAAELKEKFEALATKEDALQSLRSLLVEAVNRGDYIGERTGCRPSSWRGRAARSWPAPRSSPRGAPRARRSAGPCTKPGQRPQRGGRGPMAMSLQIGSLMWLRTTMNYQYRYGMSMRQALSTLYAEGGVPRFYRGLGPALLQGPMLRFGDTATNAGVLALFDNMDMGWCPTWFKTLFTRSTHSDGPASNTRVEMRWCAECPVGGTCVCFGVRAGVHGCVCRSLEWVSLHAPTLLRTVSNQAHVHLGRRMALRRQLPKAVVRNVFGRRGGSPNQWKHPDGRIAKDVKVLRPQS